MVLYPDSAERMQNSIIETNSLIFPKYTDINLKMIINKISQLFNSHMDKFQQNHRLIHKPVPEYIYLKYL